MRTVTDFERQVAGVATLNDPVRRALYDYVVAFGAPVSREQAAQAVGVQRSLAAFHLDKLADEGLLTFEYRRLTGRTGPGAGRPAKLYRRSDRQFDVTLPRREYDLAGRLLAAAIAAAETSGRPVREELSSVAFEFGRTLGERAMAAAGRRASRAKRGAALVDVLREHGFEPHAAADGMQLANCPFHALAEEHTDLVCGMNLHLLRGVRSVLALDDGDLEPRLAPAPGRCCVMFCTSVA